LRRTLVALTLLVMLGLMAAPAVKGQASPSLLFVSSSPTAFCSGGGGCVLSNEVNPLGPTSLFIDFNSNGQKHSVDSPVLLIVGIPGTTSAAPTIDATLLTGGTAKLGGPDVYGGLWNPADQGKDTWGGKIVSSGLVQDWKGQKAPLGKDAYDFLGLSDGSSSENFANWKLADATIGAGTPKSYTLAVYELFPSSKFSAGKDIEVSFSGLGFGDIVVAYAGGYSTTGGSSTGKKTKRDGPTQGTETMYSTPFTQAGLQDSKVPEPASMGLLATALLGAYGLLRCKLK